MSETDLRADGERVRGDLPEASPGDPADHLRGGTEPGDRAGSPGDLDARLKGVSIARQALTLAREGYTLAITEAYDAGISPTIIAGAAGVTEAAVRQTVKRNRTDG